MKRWIAKIVVFLLLGAIVNVGVAWGFAYGIVIDALAVVDESTSIPLRTKLTGWYGDRHVHVAAVVDLPGVLAVGCLKDAEMSREDYRASKALWGDDIDRGEEVALPCWSAAAQVRGTQLDASDWVTIDVANGWPTRSVRYRCMVSQAGSGATPVLQGGLALPANKRSLDAAYTGRALPLRPIWPNFAINTVFYAVILWLLALAPLTARRMIRRKRGHCIKCGYDLRGDFTAGCPECGWQRASET